MTHMQGALALISVAILLGLAALPDRRGTSAILRSKIGGIVVFPLLVASLAMGLSLFVSAVAGR